MANLADHLFRQERERGSKTALIFEDRRYSFAEIAEHVRKLAGGLATLGVGVGSRVGIMVNARPEFIFFQQAVFALGGIVTPLNIFYKKGEIAHAVQSCDLELLVAGREFLPNLPDLGRPETATVRHVVAVDLPPAEEKGGLVSASRIETVGRPVAGPVDLGLDAIQLLLNTSATTGKAKGVMLSIGNVRANYDPTPEWLGLDEGTVTLCALPLYNTFGLNQGINAVMKVGGTLVLMPKFDAGLCLKAIEDHRCTFFPGVPTMLQKLFDHPDAPRYDLTSIRRIMTGAAPVPAALLERIYATMGRETVVMTGYGLTEATAIVSLEHIELGADGRVKRPKSIGRVLPGIEMRLVTEDGREAAPNEVGEICVRGPNVMQGYYKMPGETAVAIRDGWLHTGDLGTRDEAGFAYIVDRKKDIIIRGGQNIYPVDIEEVIYRHPGVVEVAVIGVPDEVLGERVEAFVAMRSPGPTACADIIARCKDELAYFKVPAAVHFMPELPKGPTGKILRRGLRQQS